MGKILCYACEKSCKGQTIKLQDKYFHIKCFKCKECQKLLATGGFYTKDNYQYCVDDYQKLFGVRCKVCGLFVHGEVVKALNNTYHDGCFLCSICKKKFEPGDKVTLTSGNYLCVDCLGDSTTTSDGEVMVADSGGITVDDVPTLAPFSKLSASAPCTPAHQDYSVNGQLDEGKETYTNEAKPMKLLPTPFLKTSTPVTAGIKPSSGYQTMDREATKMSHISDVFNGEHQIFLEKNRRRQTFSPIQNIMRYRSVSPREMMDPSRKSKESLTINGPSPTFSSSRFETNYGKFYKSSYLDKKNVFKKGPSINPRDQSPKHYHRPGLLSSFAKENQFHEVNKSSVYKPDKSDEAIALSKIPQAIIADGGQMAAIERDDWPAPPDPAAAYPELLRDHRLKKSHASSSSSYEQVFNDEEEEDEVDAVKVAKVQKEIEELSKLSNSGTAMVLLDDLKKMKGNVKESRPLDPRSSSRTPSAAIEPPYKPRYDNPVFASPSRDLDQRVRLRSLDCLTTERKFRTPSQISNYPDWRGYEVPRSAIKSGDALRPGYLSGRMSAVEARGHTSQMDVYIPQRPDSSAAVLQSTSFYSSQNSVDGYDETTGLKKNMRCRAMTPSTDDWLSCSCIRRSAPNLFKLEEPPKLYTHDQLKSFEAHGYPPEVDQASLEIHLSKEEFELLLRMGRDEFYRLPEWKRNDLKSRVGLF